ncbi:hypothetical protein F5I97DRAFT_1889812 [Phlebopus sp. FC_14]|nr:hypothetical protein F5I97DRAFT_1889812 [Phlebopus sp. FC_14]
MSFNTSAFGTTTAAPASSSIFGQTNAPKPATTPLFGSTQPASTALGTFGAQNQPQQLTQGTSLFGGGSFGQTTQTQQQQPTTSLFGQPASGIQQQPQSTPGTSLFGSTPQPTVGQQTTGLGAFGTAAQQPAQHSTSLFGSTSQPQPTVQAYGFGTGTSGTGSSLFGLQQRQPSSMSISPTQITGPVLFSKSTKFNDLPDEIRKKFENLDSHIQGRIHISNELKQRKLGQEATKSQDLIRGIRKELLSANNIIQSDVLFTRDLKTKTEQAVQDTIIAIRIIDGFRNPQLNGTFLKNHASFPLEFFTRVTKEMQERLQWYRNTIEQIERKLSSTATQAQTTPQAIASTLQTQHGIFVALASRTAAVDAELQKVKALYTQLWRAKTGSMRDPFSDLDRGSGVDFGMESLQVK